MKTEGPTIRYSVNQVLRGIQAFVSEHFGPDVIIEPHASVMAYEEPAGDSHGCPLFFLEELTAYFGLNWGYRRWKVWLKLPRNEKSKAAQAAAWEHWRREVGPRILVSDLAAIIARRAIAPSFEPITV